MLNKPRCFSLFKFNLLWIFFSPYYFCLVVEFFKLLFEIIRLSDPKFSFYFRGLILLLHLFFLEVLYLPLSWPACLLSCLFSKGAICNSKQGVRVGIHHLWLAHPLYSFVAVSPLFFLLLSNLSECLCACAHSVTHRPGGNDTKAVAVHHRRLRPVNDSNLSKEKTRIIESNTTMPRVGSSYPT